MDPRTCTIDGCDKPTRSGKAELCKMHYHRWYRHGTFELTSQRVRVSQGRRYKFVSRRDHPLARAEGRVYVHRAVLFDSIGPGVHPCHWCTAPVTWQSTRGDADCLVVDHLNGIGDDNRLENLVPSCPPCNSDRGSRAWAEALRAAGLWSNHDTIAGLRSRGRKQRVAMAG